MRAVELRLPNRVALDIELGQLQVAVRELQDAELGPLEDDLETPLRRLGYRLGEVELAVEDFRTNARPQRAVPHVQRDAQTFADELAAFVLLAPASTRRWRGALPAWPSPAILVERGANLPRVLAAASGALPASAARAAPRATRTRASGRGCAGERVRGRRPRRARTAVPG